MADHVNYIAKSDCLVFGKYRKAGDEFKAPPWEEAYTWPMPDFIEVVGGTDEAPDAPKAPAAQKAPKAPKDPEAPAADIG